MVSMTKIGRFLRGFSVVDSSWLAVGFLDLFKTLKTQRQKSLFLHKSDFHWQSKGGLFICTLSHVKLIPEIHFCTCHKNMKSMGIFSMGQFSRVFTEKYIKNIFQEMKNGLSLRQEQCYIITWAFHKLTCRQNTMHPEKKNNTYFSSPLEDTDIFPKLLFWSDSWIHILCSTINFLLLIYIFNDSSDPFKTENGHHNINLTDDVVHLHSLLKHKTGRVLEGCI